MSKETIRLKPITFVLDIVRLNLSETLFNLSAEETTLVENPEPSHTNSRMTGKGVLGGI